MDVTFLQEIQIYILGYVALAMVLGGAIGLEREMAGKPAGLRTHVMVSGAAAFLVALGDTMVRHYDNGLATDWLRADPIRIIEAVVTGVSFLGAGTIIRNSRAGDVEGLTTAASVLFVAALGVCVALGQWLLAVGVTLFVLMVLRGLTPVDAWLQKRSSELESQS